MSGIGSKIRVERNKNGWTQVELANKMNLSKQTINNWEHGRRIPDIQTLKELSNLFNVSLEYLVGESSPTIPENHLVNTVNKIKDTFGDEAVVLFKDISDFDEEDFEKLKTLVELVKNQKK